MKAMRMAAITISAPFVAFGYALGIGFFLMLIAPMLPMLLVMMLWNWGQRGRAFDFGD